jgi:hypothetical protein
MNAEKADYKAKIRPSTLSACICVNLRPNNQDFMKKLFFISVAFLLALALSAFALQASTSITNMTFSLSYNYDYDS